jgi:transcriptional regulator with XRE-family HTH domain
MTERRYKAELKAFGKRIKDLRLERDLTQLDLEITSGIGRENLSKIERGQRNIEFRTIIKIAEALELDTWELFKPRK